MCRRSRNPPGIVASPDVNSVTNRNADRPRSVVIVDDQKPFVDLMAKMLGENLTCKVHAFTRPADALRGLARISAGVIVTDYDMPVMNGVEFIREASSLAPEAVFIMISGHNLELIDHELSQLERLKMRMQKPFTWSSLSSAVIEVWPGTDVPKYRQ
jgi:two-component SAPR family response regulator